MKEKAIVESINNLINALNSFKNNFIEGSEKIQALASDETSKQVLKPTTEDVNANIEEFESLVKALHNEKWPEAVNSNFICDSNSETDKIDRGRGIIDLMIEEDIKDIRILDFGCGEGQCSYVATEYSPTISVGYDIHDHEHWKNYKKDNLVLTSSFEEVQKNGPYNVIILFDVIDHIQNETPVELMKKVRSVLADNGKVYMRCHPFTSKHATHLYHELNKAYMHLIFNEEELNKIVPVRKFNEPNIKVTRPIRTYQNFIEQGGLKIKHRREITEAVEPFFKIPKIADRIIKNTNMDSFPQYQMSIQFIDYILVK